jgi:hypothetical protein
MSIEMEGHIDIRKEKRNFLPIKYESNSESFSDSSVVCCRIRKPLMLLTKIIIIVVNSIQ